MGEYMKTANGDIHTFIRSRIGSEMDENKTSGFTKPAISTRIRNKLGRLHAKAIGTLVKVVGGSQMYHSFQEGYFRNSGEIHRVMYDSTSLARLLKEHGFKNIRRCSAFESQIPGFQSYELDSVGKQVRKPDSLFMECSK